MNDEHIYKLNYQYLNKLIYTELATIAKSIGINKIPRFKSDICNLILQNPKYNVLDEKGIEKIEYNNKIEYYKQLAERLYDKTEPKENINYEKPCLCFIGSTYGNGYGQIKVLGKNASAHRVSYAIFNNLFLEDLTDNYDVCHGKRCNSSCIEPTHLELKSKSENNYEDKIRDNSLKRGELSHLSKISEDLAKQIKHSKGNGKTQKQRAEEFKVSISIVTDIDNNKTWIHIPSKDGNIAKNEYRRKKRRDNYKKKKEQEITQEEYNRIFIKIKDNSILSETINNNVNTQCWLYNGTTCIEDYGKTNLNGLNYKTHILMYEAVYGKRNFVENKTQIRHLCNIKSCCNPEHLIFDTHSQNMIDAIKAGSKTAKLNETKIKEIRNLLKDGLTQKEVSIKYNVTIATISRVQNKKIWSFVEDDE